MNQLKLSDIFIYPVKSLAGFRLESCEVDQKGFKYDRHWMIIDQDNRFLSQREIPSMSQIQTRISQDELILSIANDSVTLPLEEIEQPTIDTTIWRDRCKAHPVSREIDQWLSDYLHRDCQLVCQGLQKRPVDSAYGTQNDQTTFSDGFPFLIISDASLTDLNEKMQQSLPMQRFRPNLVISDCDSFAEDYWRKIQIGAISFRLPKPCSRCSVTTIDLETGQQSKEPLSTLNKFRKWQQAVYFGQNAIHDQTGLLSIGDKVQIIETGLPQPPI